MTSEGFKETEIGLIPYDWKLIPLKDLTTKIGSGATPRGGSQVYVEYGVSFIRSQNVHDEGFKADLVYINDDAAEKLKNVQVNQNDVLLNITGDSICRTSIVPNEVLPGRVNQHVAIIRANKRLYYKFLFFYLCSDIAKWRLLSYDAGGTRKAITKGTLESFNLPLPMYKEQVKIGDLLDSFNKKIRLNQEMNQTLEAIAQAIFRHWFVHYEFPDENGQPYKSSGGLMVDSELGEIPVGWNVVKASDAIEINPKLKVDRESEKIHVPMTGLSKTSMVITEFQKRKGSSGAKFQNYDTLFARITPSTEHGKTAFVQFLKPDETAIGSTEFIVMRSRTLNPYYVYCLARYENFRKHAINSMTGTSGRQRVQNECFDDYYIAQPDEKSLSRFSDLTRSLFNKINVQNDENQNLAKIRDSLLPKLMSGKIRVDVEV